MGWVLGTVAAMNKNDVVMYLVRVSDYSLQLKNESEVLSIFGQRDLLK